MALAEILICLVVGIADGDTLTARCGMPAEYQQVKVRLAEIDAPEKNQAFGQRSKEYLSALCFNQQATIRSDKKDRYGRTIARVECQSQDASPALVKAGMAWAYTKYLTDPEIKRLEVQAKSAGVGLWRDAVPVPPWEFRKSGKAAGGT
jgi:endonuclease YncB( thermonuclease family)